MVGLGALGGFQALGGFRIVSKKWTDQCDDCSPKKKKTRRERLNSAPYLRLKKRKTLFLEQIEIFEKKFSFKRSRIVPKNVKRGTLLDLLTNIPLQNIKKLKGGPFGDIKKFSKKSRTVPKKIQRGDPLGTSGFVCFLEKVKNERGDPLE